MTPEPWSQFSIAVLIFAVCSYILLKVVSSALEAFGHQFGEQVAAEAFRHAPKLAQWIIELGIRRLPAEHRERYRQEWLAELDAKSVILGEDSPLSLLAEAVRLASAAPQMARHLRKAALHKESLSAGCRVYVVSLAVISAGFVPAGLRLALENPGRALFWVAFLAVTSFRSIPILPRANLDLTFSGPVLVAASVLLPQPLAVLVSLLGRVNEREFRPDTQVWAIVFNRAQGALSAGAAAFAAMAVDAVLAGQSRLVALLAATVAASVALFCVNTIATTLLYSLRGLRIRQATRILGSFVASVGRQFCHISHSYHKTRRAQKMKLWRAEM
ncbi:MAG: hypothetical protein ACRD0K_25715 [Egibacteraceae bacterium]